jgi:hypothetical protein
MTSSLYRLSCWFIPRTLVNGENALLAVLVIDILYWHTEHCLCTLYAYIINEGESCLFIPVFGLISRTGF